MGLHRLLQRGFASLYGYTLPEPVDTEQSAFDTRELVTFTIDEDNLKDRYWQSALEADTARELHFKMQGARLFI